MSSPKFEKVKAFFRAWLLPLAKAAKPYVKAKLEPKIESSLDSAFAKMPAVPAEVKAKLKEEILDHVKAI